MKLLKRLAFGLAGLCALLLLIGFLLPSNARVERSILIDRPASVIFPLLKFLSALQSMVALVCARSGGGLHLLGTAVGRRREHGVDRQ